eukprot:7519906-Prorocentrum_lima.AAC.1
MPHPRKNIDGGRVTRGSAGKPTPPCKSNIAALYVEVAYESAPLPWSARGAPKYHELGQDSTHP